MEYKLEQNSFAKNECKIKIEHIDVSDAILPHFVKTEIKEDPFESSSLNNSTNSFFVERNSLDQTNKEINTEDIKSDDYFVDRNSLEQMNIEVKTEDIKSEDKSKSVQHENVFKTSRNILIPVKKRLRFREEDDLNLLREVAGQNPFENPFIWESIKENIYSLSQKDFSIKTLKDHLDLLIKAWLEKVKAVKDRSGIEEAYSEKDQLCQNIYDYMIQFRKMSKRKKKNTLHKNKVLGKSASDEWATKLANNAENLATDALKENVSFQDHTYCDFDEINNSIETESIPANIYLSDCNVADFTPEEPSQQPVDINNSTQTQEHSKVLNFLHTKRRMEIIRGLLPGDLGHKEKVKKSLKKHVRTYPEEKSYQCEICLKQFTQKSMLKVHMRVHTGEKSHMCELCFKLFIGASNLEKHLRTHTGEKPYQCEICVKQFTQKINLNMHMMVHTGEKPHKCEICSKLFTLKSNLKTHMKVHTGEKPHKCQICFKLFTTTTHLKLHFRSHSGEKPYECKICLRQFSAKSNLNQHLKVHAGEKPHKCKICFKEFTLKSNLSQHMKFHTGEKSYKCETCFKMFANLSDLKTHIRIHTGEKPFRCEICDKAFAIKSNLNKHMKVHSGENIKNETL